MVVAFNAEVAGGVERRGMPDIAKHSISCEKPFPSITTPSEAASDYGAFWADFSM
jgi:hypothetical protein